MATLRLAPQCCTCEEDAGPWDWYQDHSPDTAQTPYVPRTASIYEDDPPEAGPQDSDSYPDWYVLIPESFGYQVKYITASVSPLGLINSEIVYCYMIDQGDGGTGLSGLMRIDAYNLAANWIVQDEDWYNPGNPIMGAVSIGHNSFLQPGSVPTWDNFDVNAFGVDGICAHSGGVRRVYIETSGTYPDLTPTVYYEWTIDTLGAYNYTTVSFYFNYSATVGFDPFLIPQYTENFSNEEEIPWGQAFNEHALPVGHAPQGNYAIGVVHPHFLDFPSSEPGTAMGAFEVTAQVKVGPINFDEFDFPYVDGGAIWELTKTYYDGYSGISINARIDGFDAGLGYSYYTDPAGNFGRSIAIIVYRYRDDWVDDGSLTPIFQHNTMVGRTVLVIDGVDIEDEGIFTATGIAYGAPTVDNAEAAFFPRWINPRLLHTTEPAQGGGNRSVVFARVPFDQSEADADWDGETTLGEWRMLCFITGSLDYGFSSRWGKVSQSLGVITLDTSNSATITMTAIAGGLADGDAPNGTMTLDVEDTTPEDAIYNATTNNLTVRADISGGNNTVQDLADIIEAAGDFNVTGVTDGTDTVTTSNTGSGSMSGGDNSASGSVAANTPYVHDSSARHYYVVNFPMRVREVVNNRYQCYFIKDTQGYPRRWVITHDGTVRRPSGTGVQEYNRLELGASYAFADTHYGSIKNPSLLTLVPAASAALTLPTYDLTLTVAGVADDTCDYAAVFINTDYLWSDVTLESETSTSLDIETEYYCDVDAPLSWHVTYRPVGLSDPGITVTLMRGSGTGGEEDYMLASYVYSGDPSTLLSGGSINIPLTEEPTDPNNSYDLSASSVTISTVVL